MENPQLGGNLVILKQSMFVNCCFGRNCANLVNLQNGKKYIHIQRLERLNITCRERQNPCISPSTAHHETKGCHSKNVFQRQS